MGRTTSYLFSLMFTFIIITSGCEKNSGDDFSADFDFEFVDDNLVRFTNRSEGEYYSLSWDFGNGDAATTTDKNKLFTVYYPLAGNYDIKLSAHNFTGLTKSKVRQVAILASDLQISFTATIDQVNPNFVNLVNTSTGDYDSFKWVYRGREVEDLATVAAYFPFSGQYTIELVVAKGADSFTVSKSIVITRDDPGYIDNLSLSWSDEFDETTVNTTNWRFETGATGWGNNELQYYTNGDNSEVSDGKLIITARLVNENKEPGSYTSSRMITAGKKEFMYGRIEARAKLPSGTGIWPAIWMLGSNFFTAGWPTCGEVDIMEYVGYEPNTVHATIHTPSGYGGAGSGTSVTLETCEEEFHNYGIIWTEKYIKFYLDNPDNIIYTYAPAIKTPDNWPFDQPLFLILNVAVGGTWGGAMGIDNLIFPQSMEIDYVRVYQE